MANNGGWGSGTWGQAAWGGSVYDGAVSESSTLSDTNAAAPRYASAVSESTTITELIYPSGTYNIGVTNAATVADSVPTNYQIGASVDESASLADEASTYASIFAVEVIESGTVTDTEVSSIPTYNTNVNEGVHIEDVVVGRPLWDTIDTDQPSSWANIATTPVTGWTKIPA
jgi:hypothetical protein